MRRNFQVLEVQGSLFPNRTVPQLVKDIEKLTKEIQDLYCADDIPFVIGYSGGKDSTAILQLMWNAIASLQSSLRYHNRYNRLK